VRSQLFDPLGRENAVARAKVQFVVDQTELNAIPSELLE